MLQYCGGLTRNPDGLREGASHEDACVNGEVSFFQFGDEFTTQSACHGDREEEEQYGTGHDRAGEFEHPGEDRVIPFPDSRHDPVGKIIRVADFLRHHEGGHHWYISEGQDEGPYECESYGLRHGAEHLSFDAHQA